MKFTVSETLTTQATVNGVQIDAETPHDGWNEGSDGNLWTYYKIALNGYVFRVRIEEVHDLAPKDVGVRASKNDTFYYGLPQYAKPYSNRGWIDVDGQFFVCNEHGTVKGTNAPIYEHKTVRKLLQDVINHLAQQGLI